jgi:hypothetical protein
MFLYVSDDNRKGIMLYFTGIIIISYLSLPGPMLPQSLPAGAWINMPATEGLESNLFTRVSHFH